MQPRGELPGNTAQASSSPPGSARALPPSAMFAPRKPHENLCRWSSLSSGRAPNPTPKGQSDAAVGHPGRGHASWPLCQPAGAQLTACASWEREASPGPAAQARLPKGAGRSKTGEGYFFAPCAGLEALRARRPDSALRGI